MLETDRAEEVLEETDMAFLFAQKYHSAMKNVGPVRKEMGERTIFNILGPLTNPGSPKMQLLGVYDEYLVEKLQGCESLLVESNHDLNMLMVGPYPYPLKKRIMGNKGHLSNERAGQFLSKVIGEECKHIFLGHLSKENNYGELAYETVKVELLLHNIDLDKANFTLQVASRTAPTCIIKKKRKRT